MRAILRRLWKARRAIALYVLILSAGWFAGEILLDIAIPDVRPMNEPLIHRIVMGALLAYILAAAIPFVPGAEIGLALLLIFGGKASPVVYAGMVGALLLSYCVARFVPLSAVSQLARWLGLKKVGSLVSEISAGKDRERAELIASKLDGQFGRTMLRNRYVLLALLLNTPGNSILGGGGGIAFMAGISGLYSFWPYLISVLIAVAPFPLFFYLLNG